MKTFKKAAYALLWTLNFRKGEKNCSVYFRVRVLAPRGERMRARFFSSYTHGHIFRLRHRMDGMHCTRQSSWFLFPQPKLSSVTY